MNMFRTMIVALAAWPAAAFAAPAEEALKFADEFVVPRFKAVADATHVQVSAWTAFCADRGHGDLDSLKRAYDGLADAWSDVEFVRIGPAAIEMRVERFNWWLDRTDATGKALGAMLKAKPEDLMPEKLAAGSVAGQGLPVIERLLYPAAEAKKLKAKAAGPRCAVGLAVARNQAIIAEAIVNEWTAPDGARAALAANTRWKFAFADATEAASVMMTDLAAGLEGMKDFKVAMFYHDVFNAKAPRLAEAVRSGRTLRDIDRNLVAIRAGLEYFYKPDKPDAKAAMDKAFDDAQAKIKDLETVPAGPARTQATQIALTHVAILAQTAMQDLPDATGLTLGFNNLDGD